jgi:hypothetical protein
VDFDIKRNGVIDTIDLQFVAGLLPLAHRGGGSTAAPGTVRGFP